ncbi:lysozyme inhibitor LprI family protein [Sulfuricurvum sp.]|uniref:lysozyme inhibitor LprI family protein n=1 Tax=Sulfuricurvum sp. TaxID=2025608 RepID=UPI003BB7844E
MKKLLTLIFLLSVTVFGASFDCAKATSKVEKMICADPELSALDENLSKAFKEALTVTDEKEHLKEEQYYWLKYDRNTCTTKQCLNSLHHLRITHLNTAWLNKDTEPSAATIFKLIQYFDCNTTNTKEFKDLCIAMQNHPKTVELMQPIAIGNNINESQFKKYLSQLSPEEKNALVYSLIPDDDDLISKYQSKYLLLSQKELNRLMKEDKAYKSTGKLKLYSIDERYTTNKTRKAYLFFADAMLKQKEIDRKVKLSGLSLAQITVINLNEGNKESSFDWKENINGMFNGTRYIGNIGVLMHNGESFLFELDENSIYIHSLRGGRAESYIPDVERVYNTTVQIDYRK